MRAWILMLALASLSACNGSDRPRGSGGDSGGAVPDGGAAEDGGTTMDAAVPADGGEAVDSGSVLDGGGSMDANAPSDASDLTDASAEDAGAGGACTNPADQAIHDTTDVSAGVEQCARSCFGGAPCVRNCVVNDVGLSADCAECYVEITSCTIRNCLSDCSGQDSAACEACRDMAGCTDAFLTCAGF